jgi:peptidoglycan/LPS O-acetylase OafA/YrhL
MNNPAYKPRIDGLRFLAISSVLLFHFAYYIGNFVSAGSYGVNLFFVLSGFLITSILIKDNPDTFRKRYADFLGRRFLRIFPIYYLSIFLLFVFRAPHINERLIYLVTYTYNFIVPKIDWIKEYEGHFWSLSVEEQFYIFFPFVAILLRKRLKLLLIMCSMLVVVAYLQIFADIFNVGYYYARLDVFNYTSLITNMAPLSLGAIGAILTKNKRIPAVFLSTKLEISAFILIFLTNCFLAWKFQILICSVCNLLLVVKAYHSEFSIKTFDRLVNNKYAIYIGKISYGLYLYHAILNCYLNDYLFDPLWGKIPFHSFGIFRKLEFHAWIFKMPLYTIISVFLAHLSYVYIERPILALKDRYFRTGNKTSRGKTVPSIEVL